MTTVRQCIDQALFDASEFYFGLAALSFFKAVELSQNEIEKETLEILSKSCFLTAGEPGKLICK